jgi:hypothetical protein
MQGKIELDNRESKMEKLRRFVGIRDIKWEENTVVKVVLLIMLFPLFFLSYYVIVLPIVAIVFRPSEDFLMLAALWFPVIVRNIMIVVWIVFAILASRRVVQMKGFLKMVLEVWLTIVVMLGIGWWIWGSFVR